MEQHQELEFHKGKTLLMEFENWKAKWKRSAFTSAILPGQTKLIHFQIFIS